MDAGADEWSSRLGFILASIGSAVGIGNIWRFSTIVGQNGGGAYLVPYLCAVFLVGLPMMILEMQTGHRLRAQVVQAFHRARSPLRHAGWIVCILVTGIIGYYLVVTGWTLAYVVFSLSGTRELFPAFTVSFAPIISFLASAAICGAILSFGVRKGIERITTFLVPAIFVILAGMVLIAVQLPGFAAGVSYFLTPDFSVLADPLIWGAAIGQVFFSLSVGYGALLTYGSYFRSGEEIPRSAAIVTAADLAVALLAGLVIFPIVFSYGLEPAAGPELAFTTLPLAFALMPWGSGIALLFFTLLFFAAISSAISFLEVPTVTLASMARIPRRRAAALMTIVVSLVGLPAALSYSAYQLRIGDVPVLDLMDEIFGTFGLSVSGLLIAVTFSWFVDPEVIWGDTSRLSLLMRLVVPLCRYVIPAALVIVIVFRVLSWFLPAG
ncbi:MAG: sodium-dependent transporter [Methanoregulaceae archaeon]|jgi:NSS family neurotransmitter:Na+ symporter